MTSTQVICSNCNRENDPEHPFCRHCGYPIVEPVESSYFKHVYGLILSFFTAKRLIRWFFLLPLPLMLICGSFIVWQAGITDNAQTTFWINESESNKIPATSIIKEQTLTSGEELNLFGEPARDFVLRLTVGVPVDEESLELRLHKHLVVFTPEFMTVYKSNGIWWRKIKEQSHSENQGAERLFVFTCVDNRCRIFTDDYFDFPDFIDGAFISRPIFDNNIFIYNSGSGGTTVEIKEARFYSFD